MHKIKVIVNGARGKMGVEAVKTIKAQKDFSLVGELGREDNLQNEIKKTGADIVIDLTNADSVYKNALAIIQNGARPVIGTSGLIDAQIKELQELATSRALGGIIVPNFSIGAVLMMKFASIAAKYYQEVEIIETHHQQKLDAPSGTAMKTAELIASARQSPKQELNLKEIVKNVRGGEYKDINIHSLRLPGVIAKQDVIFGGVGETLTIAHNSINRESFMSGLVLACQHVLELNTLVYGLDKIIPF